MGSDEARGRRYLQYPSVGRTGRRVYSPWGIVLGWPERLPTDFVVGTNTRGKREINACGAQVIPFTSPDSGMFIGWSNWLLDELDHENSTRWSAQWHEYTVTYWFLLALLLVGPAEVGIRRLWASWKGRNRQDLPQRPDPYPKTDASIS